MTDEKLKNLLVQTDRLAGTPAAVNINIANIRRKANYRRILYFARPVAAAASLIIAVALWQGTPKQTKTMQPEPPQIASNAPQLQQLQDSTNKAIKIIQEIREKEQNQRSSAELNARLASIPDPLEKIQQEVDRTAFILVYSADRMYKELNLTDSAVETYKRVIELFPENQWAKVAQERLEKIKTENSDTHSQGDPRWQLQNA
jgi:hypothetical protein